MSDGFLLQYLAKVKSFTLKTEEGEEKSKVFRALFAYHVNNFLFHSFAWGGKTE